MLKRSIAAALLVAMAAWAEMALAPMLVMHGGHGHAAREMSEHKGAHKHAMPAGHPCCPGLNETRNAAPIELAAGSLSCQDQHRCCFLQGPQSVSALMTSGHKLLRDIAPAEIVELSPVRGAGSRVFPATAITPGPPPGMFGMVLRV